MKNSMHKFIIPAAIFFVMAVYSCNEKKRATVEPPLQDSTALANTSPKPQTSFSLEFFDQLPGDIDGCGEYFTFDTTRFAKDRYIFVSDLSEVAYIKVAGKIISLKKDKSESQVKDDRSYSAVYQAPGYKVILSVHMKEAYDEGGFYTGTLSITHNSAALTYKVHGESGC